MRGATVWRGEDAARRWYLALDGAVGNRQPNDAVAGRGSKLLPMASPPRDVSVSVASEHVVVARVSLHLDRREQVETATQYRFGITETQFLADVDRKEVAFTGPHVVRFHEVGDQIRTRIDGAVRSTWVVMSGAFLDDIASGTPCWRAPFRKPFTYPPLTTLGDLHHFLARVRAGAGALWAEEELATLLPRLLSAEDTSLLRPRPGMARLARAADEILGAEFTQITAVAELARALGVSASYLTRAYRAATGSTLHARVTRLRLSSALSRLADGAKDLTALALELGYSSHSHFSAEFKRHMGRPPSDFRLSTQM